MATRPTIENHTSMRHTAQDVSNIELIANALRAEQLDAFPTRAMAIRYALQATAEHILSLGRLPKLRTAVV